jgi:hypothetical protein
MVFLSFSTVNFYVCFLTFVLHDTFHVLNMLQNIRSLREVLVVVRMQSCLVVTECKVRFTQIKRLFFCRHNSGYIY